MVPSAAHRICLPRKWVRSAEKGRALKTILLADDEANLRTLLRITLDNDYYRIIEANDGTTALELTRQQLPDLIILDWMMPGLNGMAVAQALHEDPVTAHIPIIMLSARGQEADKERGHAVGASAYLVKPFSPMELLQTVKEILGRSAHL